MGDVPEGLTTDDAATLDLMFGQSNSVNVVDLLATVIFARAAVLRAHNLYDPQAIILEAQAVILRGSQRELDLVVTGFTKPEDVFTHL